jgi:hypothetical protein
MHVDKRAWFGVWPAGTVPPRFAAALPANVAPHTLPMPRKAQELPRKARERCSTRDCKGFTAMACPYRHCAGHCRRAGGCNTHRIPAPAFQMPPLIDSEPSLPARQPSTPTALYQDTGLSEEDALAAAIEVSHQESISNASSEGLKYNSSARVFAPTMAGNSMAPSGPSRPKITSQLGGAWLEVVNADDADRVEKEKMVLAKADAASEAKKSVDVVWYDEASVSCCCWLIQRYSLSLV